MYSALNKFRGISIVLLLVAPAIVIRFSNTHFAPLLSLLIFGTAVVAASFLLAWAAEAAQMDISGGLAIAILAIIAVLPEYAVDLYFAFQAGTNPEYAAYAAANMTGSNRLLMGFGWPVVVLLALMAAKKTGNPLKALHLENGTRMELGFLLIAGVFAFVAPLTASISFPFAGALILWFIFYLFRVSQLGVEEPELMGTAEHIGNLPKSVRRRVVFLMFAFAAVVILAVAEPFAESLIASGTELGIDEFLLVQWLAPLASEAPEFIVAILFAVRGNAQNAIGALISSKVSQWTLLVGSIPVAYFAGGGGAAGLPLDDRQVEEFSLSAMQTMMGVAILLALRFPRWGAWSLFGLFAIQFFVTDTAGRLVLVGVYAVIAIAAFIVHRKHLLPTLQKPFQKPVHSE